MTADTRRTGRTAWIAFVLVGLCAVGLVVGYLAYWPHRWVGAEAMSTCHGLEVQFDGKAYRGKDSGLGPPSERLPDPNAPRGASPPLVPVWTGEFRQTGTGRSGAWPVDLGEFRTDAGTSVEMMAGVPTELC